MSVLQEVGQIDQTVLLIFWYSQCLHLMYSELAWVQVSLKTQVQPQIKIEPDYLQAIFPFLVTLIIILKCCPSIVKQLLNSKHHYSNK